MDTVAAEHSTLNTLGELVSQRLAPAEIAAESWPELVQLAFTHGLGPMLWWVIRQSGFSLPDEELYTRLNGAAKHTAYRSLMFQGAQRKLNDAFNKVAVHAIWLKGIAIATTIYPAASLRPMVDIDVLVPYALRQRALDAALSLGYKNVEHDILRSDPDLGHHYKLEGTGTYPVQVEIHWSLLESGDKHSLLPLEQLAWFQSPQRLMLSKEGYSILKPEPNLLYICAHAILQHSADPLHLMRFFDMHRIITSADVDWDVTIDRAARLGWSLALERGLEQAQKYFGTPLPDSVLPRIRTSQQNRTIAVKVFDPDNTLDVERFSYSFSRLGLSKKLRMARVILVPSGSYMRQHYQLSERQSLWPYYLNRWRKQGVDMITWLLTRRSK